MINIVLTCTVYPRNNISWLKQRDPQERINMYIEIIKLWMENTNLNLTIIENSGYQFQELKDKYLENNKHRLEFITFTYKDIPEEYRKFLESKEAKGHHELYALNYAYNNSYLIDETSYIIKITGRYFIPELEDILKIRLDNIFNQYNIVLQNTKWRGHHRCEILGCHNNYFNKLFEFPSYNDMIEEEYTKRIIKIGTILLLPKLKLHKKTMQGVGAYLEYL